MLDLAPILGEGFKRKRWWGLGEAAGRRSCAVLGRNCYKELTLGSSGNRRVGLNRELAFSARTPCLRSQPSTWSLGEPWSQAE